MAKGVPSDGMGLFFCWWVVALPLTGLGEGVRDPQPWSSPPRITELSPRRPLSNPARPVNHTRKEDNNIMAKSKSSKVKPISIRYTCAPNGDQVGLSHYLMADAKKAK
jgi:modified peptide precursor CbpA